MTIRTQAITTLIALFGLSANAADPFDFEGQWCGKWDGVYNTCLTVSKQPQGFTAFYEWEEQLGAALQKKSLKGVRVNDNTLNFEGKFLIINLKDPNIATAVGMFKSHSRIAPMVRVTE
ncbi:MAG: hypothetical protein HWE13_02005 [Gammaproteobacteria bacterium]|nr:hypothetical protein [Gammaproteobacteria bacterium]NVK86866.1 hypothetical protein [Gammaproteobacteria bacterium]